MTTQTKITITLAPDQYDLVREALSEYAASLKDRIVSGTHTYQERSKINEKRHQLMGLSETI